MPPIESGLPQTYAGSGSDDTATSTPSRQLELPTRVLTGFLFFVLGIIILLLLLVITVATVVTKSNWWIRRRRTCQRRMDYVGAKKPIPLEEKLFYYADIVLDAIALHWSDEDSAMTGKSVGKPKIGELVGSDGTQLPLRFQPEKLYGATSNVHRESMRKRSSSFLSVQPQSDGQRRASMVDSLTFLSPTNRLKFGKSTNEQTAHLPDYKLAYPQLESTKPAKWNTEALPLIDVTLDKDETGTGDEADGVDDSRSDREQDANSILSIAVPIRRASATNIPMTESVLNRRASFADTLRKPQVPVISLPSTTDDEELGKTENSEKERNTLCPIQTNLVKRNSMVENLSNFRSMHLTSQPDASLTDTELSTVTQLKEGQDKAELEQGEHRSPISVAESPRKLPHLPPLRNVESPAGQMALAIKLVEDANSTNDKLDIHFISGKLLKSPRPWQKGSFILKCAFHSLHHVQHSTLICKDAELGRLCFPPTAHVTFDLCDRQSKQCATTMNQLKITIVEGGSKWGSGREYYHGTVSIQLSGIQILTGKPEWYPISAAYPVIRIKADLLVSLCQRQWEGFVSLGVHEIRNIELQKKGHYSLDDLDSLTGIEQSGFEIHACLTYDCRLVKSKKSVFLQQPRHAPKSEKSHSGLEKRLSVASTSRRMSFSRTVSGEHYLQFSVPQAKTNVGKSIFANYGIVLFVTTKLPLVEQLPADFVNQLRLIGAPDPKSLQAVGECFIADEPTQSAYWSTMSFKAKCDTPCTSLWNEAANNGSARAYQWLTTT